MELKAKRYSFYHFNTTSYIFLIEYSDVHFSKNSHSGFELTTNYQLFALTKQKRRKKISASFQFQNEINLSFVYGSPDQVI